jgi:hypothetical protein
MSQPWPPIRAVPLVLIAVAAAVFTILFLLALGDDEQPHAEAGAEVGAPAPTFEGDAVRGGEISLERLQGNIVLLSFLNSRAETTPDNDPSRAQMVFVRSMQAQHERYGIRVIVVDAAVISDAGTPSRSELVNYTFDWNLGEAIAVIADDGTFARRFAVDMAPTTFLIGPDGVVRQRWDGFVTAAPLDFAIRELEGRGPTD